MKTLLLAATAILALGVGSAFAADGSEGGTAVGQAWAAENGIQTVPASVAQANRDRPVQYQVAGLAQHQNPAFNTYQDNGQG